MSFIGAVSSTLNHGFTTADQLVPSVARRFGDRNLALWGDAQSAQCGAQGIVLVGRIFGVRDLARRLNIESQDAPAVLLHAYRQWGLDFPDRVHGEYAFALWDEDARRLALGRDPSGYWPLFYTHRGESFFFASEIRHLLFCTGVTKRPNERRIAEWLAIYPVPTNQTFFDDIFSVRPGCTAVFEHGRVSERDFWQPEKTPLLRARDSRQYAEGLVQVLDQAIRDRLPVDAPAATQMSGGLDSSTVTVTAAHLLAQEGRRLFAFTAVPAHSIEVPGRFSDESSHAAAVAAMYRNIDHVLVRHGAHRVFSLIDLFNSAQGEPVFNPGNYDWIYGICQATAQRGSNTLLVGNCGNFTFSYAGNRALRSLLFEGRFHAFVRLARDIHQEGSRWLGIGEELVRPWMPAWSRHAIDHARKRPSATSEYSLIRPDFARHHSLGKMTLEEAHLRLDSRALRLMFLRRADSGPVTSAFRTLTGVQMSDPAGDRRVIEYCLSVPVEYYCEKGVPRSLIRNAMIGRLPEMVRTERRKGLQAADFGTHFEVERPEAWAEVQRLKQVDLAARALDLQAMETMLRMSPAQIAERGGINGFWPKLLRALSLGRFLRRLEDGTLFSVPETPAETVGL